MTPSRYTDYFLSSAFPMTSWGKRRKASLWVPLADLATLVSSWLVRDPVSTNKNSILGNILPEVDL